MMASLCGVNGICRMRKLLLCFAKKKDSIKAFAPKHADKTFGNSILPWRSGANRPVTVAHCPEPAGEYLAVGAVIVADEVTRRRSFKDMLSQPLDRMDDLSQAHT
jgi:hypothetical protein